MAAASAPAGAPAKEQKFAAFLFEVGLIENRDKKWTSSEQIERLTKPGAKYRNLNPFEVLQLDPGAEPNVIKKQYRKLSILCHPDKNPNQRELAEQAFAGKLEQKRLHLPSTAPWRRYQQRLR